MRTNNLEIEHAFNQISAHVYWLSPDSSTDRPILGAVAGERGTLIVDAGNSPAHAATLLSALAQAAVARPAFLVLTHWHWDHIFGTSTFDLPIIGQAETRRVVAELAQLSWSDQELDRRVASGAEIAFCRDMIKAELPDRTGLVIRPPEIAFAKELQIDLGGVTCQLAHIGGDHAADSTVVYVPEDKIVFLGDCIYPDIYHQPRRYTTAKLLPLLDRLLGYDADYYLAAHNPEPMSRAQMIAEATLLSTIGRAVAAHGNDLAAILADLEQQLDTPIDDDHHEIIGEFLAGLS